MPCVDAAFANGQRCTNVFTLKIWTEIKMEKMKPRAVYQGDFMIQELKNSHAHVVPIVFLQFSDQLIQLLTRHVY